MFSINNEGDRSVLVALLSVAEETHGMWEPWEHIVRQSRSTTDFFKVDFAPLLHSASSEAAFFEFSEFAFTAAASAFCCTINISSVRRGQARVLADSVG